MKSDGIVGYKMRDGEIIPRPIENEIVKYIFEKHNEYCEHLYITAVRVYIENCPSGVFCPHAANEHFEQKTV